MDTPRAPGRLARWLPWVLGAALLATVITAALHYSEERALVHVAQRARPAWLALAVLLQASTYAAQGGIWRTVSAAVGRRLSRGSAFELSLAKLFADQALPSAGASGSIVVARALERLRLPAPAVHAAVLINVASYYLAFVLPLGAALLILARGGHYSPIVLGMAGLFLLLSLVLGALTLVLPGGRHERLGAVLARVRPLRAALDFVAGADPRVVRNVRVLGAALALQTLIVLLDTATVWTLVAAFGEHAPVSGVFASFMIASLFRTMGIVPGGLGTFEAISVLTLRMAGIALPVALAATLLFRGLSFWLPMLPGYWCSRRIAGADPH